VGWVAGTRVTRRAAWVELIAVEILSKFHQKLFLELYLELKIYFYYKKSIQNPKVSLYSEFSK
jgi:hypothetical protein